MKDNALQVRLSGLQKDVTNLKTHLLDHFKNCIDSVSDEIPNRWDKGIRLYILLDLKTSEASNH